MKKFNHKTSLKIMLFILLIDVFSTIKSNLTTPEGFGVDFFTSMAINGKHFNKQDALKNPKARLIKSLYDNYIINNLIVAETPRIPKIIHQVWLGKPMPELYREWQKKLIDLHPGWTYMLWDEKALEKFGLINKKLFDKATQYAFKADIARYEVVYRLGGFYLDTDIEPIQPLDILLYCCDFLGACDPDSMRIQNCIFAAKPGNPILKKCIDRLSQINVNNMHDITTQWKTTGPDLLTNNFYATVNTPDRLNERWVIFPSTYFFPLSKYDRFNEAHSGHPLVQSKIQPETFAIHYWHTSWTQASFKPSKSLSSFIVNEH